MLKKIWNDPVWSKVIATGIIALVSLIATYFFGLWPTIKKICGASVSFITSSTETPNWLLGIMSLCSILMLILIVALIKESIFPPKNEVNWKSYTKDNFFGLEWRWKYDSEGSIYNLFSCCEKCKYQVFPEYVPAFSAVSSTHYKCDSCGFIAGPFAESADLIESKVKRFIQQKLRTGRFAETTNI